jgi:uncharacterized protein (TIGR02001 family)
MEMNMKKVIVILLVCVVLGGISVAEDVAEAESGIGVDVTFDFNSKYVWRGQNLVDDWVFQPGASKSFGDLTLGIWGSMDMTNQNDQSGNVTEVDYYADYSAALTEGIGYSVGFIYYAFPQASNDTQEVYGGLSFDTFLSPSVTWYYDCDEVNGSYVAFGLGHSIELPEGTPFGVDLGLNVGWADSNYNEYYWGVDDSAFNDLTLSVSFPMEIGGWSLTPSVSYVTLLDSDIRATDAYDSKSDYVFAGISLGTSF